MITLCCAEQTCSRHRLCFEDLMRQPQARLGGFHHPGAGFLVWSRSQIRKCQRLWGRQKEQPFLTGVNISVAMNTLCSHFISLSQAGGGGTCISGSVSIESGFPGGANGKEPPANAGDVRDVGSIPGSGRCPGGAHGNPHQYSCLGQPQTEGPSRLQPVGLQRARNG